MSTNDKAKTKAKTKVTPVKKGKPTPEDRRQVFATAYTGLRETYSPNEIGLLCGLGRNQTRSDLDRKMRDPSLASYRGVAQHDALLFQLLALLDKEGFDLAGFEFSDQGELIDAPRRLK